MQNEPIDQNECQPLTAAEAQQTEGGAKGVINFPPSTYPPGIVIGPFIPICGPFPIFDPERGITIR